MSKYADFLVEIQTEELPPKALQRLEKAFLKEVRDRLTKSELNFKEIISFATPRRLALLVLDLQAKQNDSVLERKGPALENAYDKEGKPTPAAIGFARSCSLKPEQLIKIKTEQGSWIGIKQKIAGKSVQELLPTFIQQALDALPIPKRMRWGTHTIEFVRPVHSVILLFGGKVIPATILGCRAGRKTRGHRFLSKGWLEIKKPTDYESILENKGFVIPSFERRKAIIREEASLAAKKVAKNTRVFANETLLDEVTGLVEWPVAITGQFDKSFLNVPQEVLISSMQDHQRYFALVDEKNKLLPQFVAMINIPSRDVARVIEGNERVLKARLADAAFFFSTDKKSNLENRLESLKKIIFQTKLGTLYDKSQRLAAMTTYIGVKLKVPEKLSGRAGLLAKTDLTTQLVGEFPELQGVAGQYYALHDGEDPNIAKALNEQYMPRFSGDALPETPLGYALAIADRLDTLLGIFGINQHPTGDKDPFGLRRSALGVLRIIIENKLNLDLRELLEFCYKTYPQALENKNTIKDALQFIFDRLKPWYLEQGISADVFAAVAALNLTSPYDIHCRIQAVQEFKKQAEAESLSVANKRVSNILSQYSKKIALTQIDEALFEHNAERTLAKHLKEHQIAIGDLSKTANYPELLSQLANLRKPIDDFFDHVMVMADDKNIRENRLLILKKLRELFLNVADIALLQQK